MKLKTLIIMALLSVSALGSCQTGRNSNVTELTKEQKDNLKYLYKWYQAFTDIKPGIPEGKEAKERTEPLPWEETGGEFDPAPLKDWMTHARLGEDETYAVSGRLALDGVYDPDENWNQADEIPDNLSSDNPYEQKIASIKMFGNMRFNLLSRLRNTEGDTLKLLGSAMLYMSPLEKKFSLSFRTNKSRSADIEGSIEAELLPPLRWKYIRIPLLPEGKEYELKDKNWPTLNAKDPYALSIEEEELMRRIKHSFECSEKLKKHMRCLFTHGIMYQVCNSNLLFHASVPMNPDGTLKAIRIEGTEYKGKALLDKVDQLVRTAYFDADDSPEKDFAMDYIWYLWEGKDSPLFDKSRMATFERCFIDDKSVKKEEKGAYYSLREEESVCDMLLDEFGVTGRHRHIINGHVPVRSIKGENPIKANGKLLVIDGGFSKAYHPETGIAGYTLVYHSRGFQLVQHEPFLSTDQAIKEGKDIRSTTIVVELNSHRQMVKDTDKGADLQQQIHDLEKLLYAFRNGFIKEKERYK